MAKRARGTTRPGQRRPIQRASRPAAGSALIGTPEAPAPAATVTTPEAGLTGPMVPERQLEGRRADRSRTQDDVAPAQRRAGLSGRLAVESVEEYRYVARDIRRIALVGGSMFVILAVLFVILELAGVAQH